MDADQAMSGLWYVLALVLVGSALLARRAPLGGMFRMTLLWAVIFIALLGLFKLGEQRGYFPARTVVSAPSVAPGGGSLAATPSTRALG